MKVTARVVRDGKWWAIHVPELDIYTQAARLDEVTGMVKDAASLLTDRPESDFDVSVDLSDRDYAALAEDYRIKSEAARQADLAAAAASRAAVAQMRADGLTLRDTAQVLGLSVQRVSQLARAS